MNEFIETIIAVLVGACIGAFTQYATTKINNNLEIRKLNITMLTPVLERVKENSIKVQWGKNQTITDFNNEIIKLRKNEMIYDRSYQEVSPFLKNKKKSLYFLKNEQLSNSLHKLDQLRSEQFYHEKALEVYLNYAEFLQDKYEMLINMIIDGMK